MPGLGHTESDRRAANARALTSSLTVEECHRRAYRKATRLAGEYLAARGLDHDATAAQRLAFGLWLKASGRLDGEFTLAKDG